jgi:hypothetical protein
MGLSRVLVVRQKFPRRALEDVAGAVRETLAQSGLAAALRPGARIAIGVGSRGVSNTAAIVRAVAGFWKDAGCAPFIFPAMGSHGAATAEGQARVLAHHGVDEASMGCPVASSLDVVSLGRTAGGVETFLDRHPTS